MAEIVAIIAASLQLSEQAFRLLAKAKRFWNEIDQAPSRIEEVVRNLENLQPILKRLRSYEDQIKCGSHMVASYSYFSEAYDHLNEFIQDLNREIGTTHGGRRKALAAKFIRRKALIDRLETRLDKAMRVLQVSLELSNM